MILKPKSCSFPLQRYGCCKNHFCIHVSGDVNLDKLVHENMFYSVITGYPKSGHIWTSCSGGLELSLNQIPELSFEVMKHCKGPKMTQKMGNCP